ncbi:CoA transferase [Roseomonas sp. ACRSG]|nr:CoA transferase [Roseomonas sp. ACRSG]
MTRPLDGILVVSLEQAIAAPYCTRLLADLGARVIKVERPDSGDFARAYDKRARGLASHFVWCNRSKESVTLDLKSPAGVEALRGLIARADVLVQNLAPGALARLGPGFDTASLRQQFPRLVLCGISGFGTGGPAGQRKAYDLLIQAEAGFLSVTGTPAEMAKSGLSIADIASGVTAQSAILAALIQRGRTGQGDVLDVSMLEAMTEWMGYPLYYAMDGAPPPPRAGAGHATIYPYGMYATSDGAVLFGLQNDREWANFCTHVLQREDLATDPACKGNAGRAANRTRLEPVIVAALGGLTTEDAMARLERADIGTASVNDMHGVWAHPQLAARKRWAEVATPVGMMPALRPVAGEGWTPRLDPVPALGEHTEAVLREFGLATTAAA